MTRSQRDMRALYPALVATAFLAACSEQPNREVWAVVVSIAPHASPKWRPDEVVVTARSQDGAMGSKSLLTARLTCRVGDTVHASARGITLSLDDHACEQ